MIVETLQGRHRRSLKPILAVVVVFNHKRAGACGPAKKGHPPLQRHGYSQRELVSRRYVRALRIRTDLNSSGNRQPFLIHWYSNNPGSDIVKRDAGSEVPRIFHPYRIALFQEQPCQQVERLLYSGNEDDLLRGAAHPTRRAQILGDCIAQWPIPTPIRLFL